MIYMSSDEFEEKFCKKCGLECNRKWEGDRIYHCSKGWAEELEENK